MSMDGNSFGLGAYTPAEAAQLIGVAPKTVRRWLLGYSYDHHGPQRSQPPLWKGQYDLDAEEPILGFRDLIEARMVASLKKAGFGLPTIRACMASAAEIANDTHPFSSASFRTDGKKLFLERLNEDGSLDLIELKTKQHAFHKIVEQSFVELDFDTKSAIRWFPLSKSKSVVADPARSFGQPIAVDSGIPTHRLAQVYVAEGKSIDRVAKLFEIASNAVRDALMFERQIGRLAAA